MHRNNGLYQLLEKPIIYKVFRLLTGSNRMFKWFCGEYIDFTGVKTLLDMGCGIGTLYDYLPKNIEYFGFDPNENYLAEFHKRHNGKPNLIKGTAHDLLKNSDPRLHNLDMVVCTGVLHHLTDPEIEEMLELAKRITKPGGQFIFHEPAYLAHHSRLSRWFMSLDRGKNTKSEKEWRTLLNRHFSKVETDIATGLDTLYVLMFGKCSN